MSFVQTLKKETSQSTPLKQIELDVLPSYLAMIEGSVGSNMFRKSFFSIDGQSIDVLEDGDLACANYVSAILYLFDLIQERHTTVNGTIEDLELSGWHKIDSPKKGAIILWGFKKLDNGTQGTHRHVGFYIDGETAISNDSETRVIKRHHITYGTMPNSAEPRRDIQAFYWHPLLDK